MEEELARILATGPGATAPAKPRVRTTSPGGGERGEDSARAARRQGQRGPPEESDGSMGVEERGALSPRIPSALVGSKGRRRRREGAQPHSPPLVRRPSGAGSATPCRRSRAASVGAAVAEASGPAGRKAKRKRRLRPPAAAQYTHLVRKPPGLISGGFK